MIVYSANSENTGSQLRSLAVGVSSRSVAAFGLQAVLVFLSTGCLAARRDGGARLVDVGGAPAAGELAGETELAVHGMVLFGEQGQFMYHLPMWWSPHAWHMVLEVALDRSGQALYQGERVGPGEGLVTFYPRMFPLSAVAPGFTVEGELYRGHFELGGTELPSPAHPQTVTVTIKRIVTLAPLKPDAPAQAGASYRVFGAGNEWYAAHVPAREPDYDQVIKLEPVAELVSEAELGAGFVLSTASPPFPASRGGARVGDVIEGTLAGGKAASLRVMKVEYFGTRDLGN